MPRNVERRFERQAKRIGLKRGTPRWRAYVYGGMAKRGLLPSKRRSLGQGKHR